MIKNEFIDIIALEIDVLPETGLTLDSFKIDVLPGTGLTLDL